MNKTQYKIKVNKLHIKKKINNQNIRTEIQYKTNYFSKKI